MTRAVLPALLADALVLVARPVQAQTPAARVATGPAIPSAPDVVARDEAGRIGVRATRITQPLRVDGRLDDFVYSDVKSVADFIQQEPREGEPASEKTEVWLLFDEDNFYVSVRCWDGDMAHVVANDMRRDSQNLTQHDNVSVILDTFHDGRNGVLFLVTAIGGMADGLVTDERQYNGDWNTVWNARVARHEWGWSTELVIPFKSLRYNASVDQIWGVNVRRTVRRRNEWTYLTRVPASYGINGIY